MPHPIPIAIAGREEHVPSINPKVAATTGTIDAHFDHLNAQLQKIALNSTIRPVLNRDSESSSSRNSTDTDSIVLSAGATPGLASSTGTPVSDESSVSLDQHQLTSYLG